MILRVYRVAHRGISHGVRAGAALTLCGQPCDDWNRDRAASLREVACPACRRQPIERHGQHWRTRDHAFEFVLDTNGDAWRDMATQATGTLPQGGRLHRFRGVWLVYETHPDNEGEPLWLKGRRAFRQLRDARRALLEADPEILAK